MRAPTCGAWWGDHPPQQVCAPADLPGLSRTFQPGEKLHWAHWRCRRRSAAVPAQASNNPRLPRRTALPAPAPFVPRIWPGDLDLPAHVPILRFRVRSLPRDDVLPLPVPVRPPALENELPAVSRSDRQPSGPTCWQISQRGMRVAQLRGHPWRHRGDIRADIDVFPPSIRENSPGRLAPATAASANRPSRRGVARGTARYLALGSLGAPQAAHACESGAPQ